MIPTEPKLSSVTDPIPALVATPGQASQLHDEINAAAPDQAENSTSVASTVSTPGNDESHPDLTKVEEFPEHLGERQAVSDVSGGQKTPITEHQDNSGSRVNHGVGLVPMTDDGTASPSSVFSQGGPAQAARASESDAYRVGEANRRLEILNTFHSLIEQGKTKAQACRLVGTGYSTMWRWIKGYAKDGFNGLLPDTHLCGRTSLAEKSKITKVMIDEIRGLNLDVQSDVSALRIYAQSDRCSEALAAIILDPNKSSKHALPASIRRVIQVTAAERLAHRGKRALSLGGIWTPRKLDILPGDIFVSDDTTPIWAWWVPWEKSEEYPFGVKLLQGQFLPVIDVASQKCITFVLIAREKSSYRASDIWGLFGHTFDAVGIPRLGFQLERASWEAQQIAGVEIEYQEGEVTHTRRVGGLRQLPTNITPWHLEKLGQSSAAFPKTLQTWTSYLPKTKSIEAFFNRSQTLEGTLYGCLGRDQMRQPFEAAKKKFQECSRVRAKEDPRNHFLSQAEIAARLVQLMNYLNNEPIEGEVFKGVPDQIWASAIAEYPLLKLGDEMRWLYQSHWKPVTITQGWARVRATDELTGERYSLFYGNPEVFARHEGADVVVYYDRFNFEAPAQILLARTGEFLCTAEYVERRGSFLGGDKTGHDLRKRWGATVMSAYATIAKHAPSRQLPAEIAARRQAKPAPTVQTPAPEPAAIRPMSSNRSTQQLTSGITAEALQRRRARNAEEAALSRNLITKVFQ